MASKFKTNTRAWRRDAKRFAAVKPSTAYVEHTSSAGRTAEENAEILDRQAAEGRDAISMTRGEIRQGLRHWTTAVNNVIASGARQPLNRHALKVAQFMVAAIKAHVRRGYGGGGRIKPVKPSTQRRKDRDVGRGKPALVWTGALLNSLRGKVS
ncbi:MAG: hypothetical protein GY835_23925 [bacterium]|nr:hypothetical protein [bacterium]